MTLLEVTEPFFQYVCRLNRAGRKGGAFDFVTVRADVESLLREMRAKCAADYKLDKQYEAIEWPLVFFVDFMISESKLSCAREWDQHRMAFENNELAGDQKFFDFLDEALKDPSREAAEPLSVYYTCLGLGFEGYYFGQPELLRKKMIEVSHRIRHLLEADPTSRVCPEAYNHVDSRDLIEPPVGRVWLMVVIFFVCAATAVGCNLFWFHKASNELTKALAFIIAQDPTRQNTKPQNGSLK